MIMNTYLKEVKINETLIPFNSISDAVRDRFDVRSIGNAVPKSFLRRLLVIFEDEVGKVYYAQKPESNYMINRVYGCLDQVLSVFAKIDEILNEYPGVIVTVEDNEYVMSRTMPKRIAFTRDKMKKVDIEELR